MITAPPAAVRDERAMLTFMFATGIENSVPTINNRRTRIDELEKCGFYKHWRTDFDLVQDQGIRYLRYGPPIHTTWLGEDRYDWAFADETFADLKRRDIVPIVDLCHFGVPDWIGDFQNPDFPRLFERYARDFAARFPWVQLYTPVNEMFICATFSARWGWWNEQMSTDRSFVTALKHLVQANILAMHAILDIRSDALFIQSESSEHFHPVSPEAIGHADAFNEQRYLSLDLNYGVDVSATMLQFLMDNGMTADEYKFFRVRNLRHFCIMGNDYYITNEHIVYPDGRTEASGEIYGYHTITQQYYQRYRLPVMHTETNLCQGPQGNEAVTWLYKEWANILRIRLSGVPVLGFTWYSLTDQVDWDVALREERGTVNPLGLYDLDRNIRPVGRAYQKLISDWTGLLQVQSICLTIPVFNPSEQEDPLILRQQAEARANWLALGRFARPELRSPTIPPSNRELPVGSAFTHA
jgi:beta-glucosidase/6-phospho-beta-glucosidase/beta-galactosidase